MGARDAGESSEGAAANCIAVVRSEIGRARTALLRIEEELSSLEREQRPARAGRERPERYLRLLVDVYDRGGRHGVDADELGAIGKEHGYDRRGLGGFFTGARAPLRRVGERVRLTPEGEFLVGTYLHRLAP